MGAKKAISIIFSLAIMAYSPVYGGNGNGNGNGGSPHNTPPAIPGGNHNYDPTSNNGGNNNGNGHHVDETGTGGVGHTTHGNGNGYGHAPGTTQVPFDGGILVLLGAGAALGLKKYRQGKRKD